MGVLNFIWQQVLKGDTVTGSITTEEDFEKGTVVRGENKQKYVLEKEIMFST